MLVSKRNREPEESVSLIESDRWQVDIATAHVEYPASKLKTDNLDDHTRAWGQRQSHTQIVVEHNFVESVDIDYVAVFGINRYVPSLSNIQDAISRPNQARLIIDNHADAHQPPVTGTGFSLTNLTGSHTVLNQVLNPPEEAITGGYSPSALTVSNPALGTSVTGNFDNSPDRILTGEQVIYVHIRDSLDSTVFPTIYFTIRQSNNDVAELAFDEIEVSSEGYIFKYVFDASILLDGFSVVGFRIDGDSYGTSAPEPMSVVWYTSVTGTLFDSGWQTLNSSDRIIWTPNFSNTSGNTWIIVQLSDFGYVVPTVFDDPPNSPATQSGFMFTPYTSALVVGRFAAGSAIELPLITEGGYSLHKVGNNQGSLAQSRGGILRATRNDLTRWEIDFTVTPQSQTRLFGEIDELLKALGNIIPALFIPDTDQAVEELAITGFWSLVTSFEAIDLGLLIGYDYVGQEVFEDKRFDVKISISEMTASSTRKGE